ncbi:Rep family protein [Lactobacillus sp. ESL0679]|uniref:Rep family protein n=1 Tax=Lactobacillus sp. ESL0679 TaxID=2983209 RepID=UPI0032AEB996
MEKRARQFMYVQYLEYLKIELLDLDSILSKSSLQEWAYILHDKDVDKNGELIRPHVHVVLKYTHPQVPSHVARLFKDKSQYLEVWKGKINNAYSYLIHATSEAKNKYQYGSESVIASFDFAKRLEKIQARVKKSNVDSRFVLDMITQYGDQKISYNELVSAIGFTEVARNKRVIDNLSALIADKKHEEWLVKFKDRKTEVIWLWGAAGVGKTRYAKWLVKGEKAVTLGSSRDYFQDYHGENYVILNDLRPSDFKYADLLRLLDPYEHDKSAPRRYHDVKLNIEMLVITTPYSPRDFYKQVKLEDPEVDTFAQLNRRVHEIHITSEFTKEIFGDSTDEFIEWP